MEFGISFNSNYGLGPVNPDELREDVRKLYEKYRDKFTFRVPNENEYGNQRRFYVYEWFTKDKEKIFYVGKGTGKRYNHIIREMGRCRGMYYQELQDNLGIDYRIVADKLTNLEAEIYEICWFHQRTSQGEVLIQFVDMPYDLDAYESMREMYKTRNFTPQIEISEYRRRYFEIIEKVDYDAIEAETLIFTHFLPSDWMVDPYTSDEKEEIRKYVAASGGRVYTSLAKGAKSVIEFGNLDYDKYCKLKDKGYIIYHSFHVLDYIRNNKPNLPPKEITKKKVNIPKFDINERNEMREYLELSEAQISEIITKNADGFEPEMKGLGYKREGNYKEAIKYLEVSVRMKFEAPAAYLQLAIIHRKFGMFQEELAVLKQAIGTVYPASIGKIKDRISKVEDFIL